MNISPSKDVDDYDVPWKELSKSMKLAYFRELAVNFTGCRGIYISIGKYLISDKANSHESSSLNKDKNRVGITKLNLCVSS